MHFCSFAFTFALVRTCEIWDITVMVHARCMQVCTNKPKRPWLPIRFFLLRCFNVFFVSTAICTNYFTKNFKNTPHGRQAFEMMSSFDFFSFCSFRETVQRTSEMVDHCMQDEVLEMKGKRWKDFGYMTKLISKAINSYFNRMHSARTKEWSVALYIRTILRHILDFIFIFIFISSFRYLYQFSVVKSFRKMGRPQLDEQKKKSKFGWYFPMMF